ncbi:hypothetical protein [Roseateles sp. P5_E4]
MAEPDTFDPTHALDGWRPPAPVPVPLQDLALGALLRGDGNGQGSEPLLPLVRAETVNFDPTHLLDGWRPPAPAPLDLELRSLVRAGRSGPDEAKKARLKARGYEMLDVEDIELPEAPPPRIAVELLVREVSPAPPLAEAEFVPPPVSEVPPAPPVEGPWPLFEAEAQVLEEMASAPAEPDAVDSPGAPPLFAAEAAWLDLRFEPPQIVEDDEALAEPPPATAVMHGGEAFAAPSSDVGAAALMADVEAPEVFAPEPTPFIDIAESIDEPPQPAAAQAPESLSAPLPTAPALVEDAEPLEIPPPAAVEAAVLDPEPPTVEPEPEPLIEPVELPDEPLQPAVAQMPEPPPAPPLSTPAVAEDAGSLDTPPATVETPVLDFRAPPPAVVEAPVLDFRAPPPPPEPDPQQVLDDIELPKVVPLPTAVEAPVLDMQALASRSEPDPRLVAEWQPQAWTALTQHVADASTEVSQTAHGLHVENHATQWLCALWPPQDKQPALLARWPEMVTLVGAATRVDALASLLEELPAEAALWPAELEADWGLVAELVLRQDTGLRPTHAQVLREFVEAERRANLARLNAGYQSEGRVARRKP